MESCVFKIKLSDDMFGSTEEAQDLLLLEADINQQLSIIAAGRVESITRGGGVAELIIIGDDANVIFGVIMDCVVLDNLSPGSSITICREKDDGIESAIIFAN